MTRRLGMVVFLAVTACGLLAGAVLHLAGAGAAGDLLWAAVTCVALVPAAGWVVSALRGGRLGVDAIAVLALAGALAVREYLAGALIGVMLATGRALEDYASRRARRDLTALYERAPHSARRYRDGVAGLVEVEQVRPGDLLLIPHGETVPVDGVIAKEPALLDESALTGESVPVKRATGERVRSGVVNAGPAFDLWASRSAAESTYAGVVRLARQAEADSAPVVRLADRFAVWFLPLTLLLAGAAWLLSGQPVRAVAVLVVATPCPLLLAAPAAIASGLSRTARHGVVVKGGAALERLGQARTLIVDKTGTLTAGRPQVVDVVAAPGARADDVLRWAAAVDQMSSHVLAAATVEAARTHRAELPRPTEVLERPGTGTEGVVEGRRIAVGKATTSPVRGLRGLSGVGADPAGAGRAGRSHNGLGDGGRRNGGRDPAPRRRTGGRGTDPAAAAHRRDRAGDHAYRGPGRGRRERGHGARCRPGTGRAEPRGQGAGRTAGDGQSGERDGGRRHQRRPRPGRRRRRGRDGRPWFGRLHPGGRRGAHRRPPGSARRRHGRRPSLPPHRRAKRERGDGPLVAGHGRGGRPQRCRPPPAPCSRRSSTWR